MSWALSASPNPTADTAFRPARRNDRCADRIWPPRPTARAWMPCLRTRLARPGALRRRPDPVPRAPVVAVAAGKFRRRRDVERRYGRQVGRHSRHGRQRRWSRRRHRRHGRPHRTRWGFSPRPSRRTARHGPRRQRRPLDGSEDPVVDGDPVIGRDALGKQIRIQWVGTQDMLFHRQRHEGWSLLQISTVGARLPGCPMQG